MVIVTSWLMTFGGVLALFVLGSFLAERLIGEREDRQRPGYALLPGDIKVERGNFRFYFPLTTSIVLSLLLTLVLRFFS